MTASRAFGNTRTNLGQYLFFGYLQDTWNVLPNVTLDLGVRYQYAQIPQAYRNQGMNSTFDVPGLISFREPQVNRWNLAPLRRCRGFPMVEQDRNSRLASACTMTRPTGSRSPLASLPNSQQSRPAICSRILRLPCRRRTQ